MSLVVASPSKTPNVRPFHFLYRDDFQVGRTHHQWQLFRYLECELDHMLADMITSTLLLHAGAVSKGGVGIVIPGESGSGKSSLTLALLRSGYEYFSDEIAVLDPGSATLRPFPKPLSVKNRSIFSDLAERENFWFGSEDGVQDSVWYVHPEDLGARVAEEPAAIRYVIFPSRCSNGETGLLPLTPGEAFQKLVANSINLHRLGSQGFHMIADIVGNSKCFSLKTGDLDTSVALVDRLVGAQA